MAPKNHFDPEVPTDSSTVSSTDEEMTNQPAICPSNRRPLAQPYETIPPVDVVFLKAYIAKLESELEQRDQHLVELTNHYDSLLAEQNRAYQTWIREVEGELSPCWTDTTTSNCRQDPGMVTKLINKLLDRK